MSSHGARAKWIEAALNEVANGGVERVRVEVIAQALGVTKGGFYWHFRDRRDLLDAILESWSEGRIAAIEKQTELECGTARDRLRALIRLYSERVNPHGMAIELAIRQWARSDKSAAAAVAMVDAARLQQLVQLFDKLGLTQEESETRALLFYSFVFGQSLLFLNHDNEKRKLLTAACASLLIEEGEQTSLREITDANLESSDLKPNG
jgi:AcrR family transcriptional regulator